MEIHKSAEDYLETILKLQKRNGQVRSIDIVAEMNFSKPSVSVAMKKLREPGHVEMDSAGLLTLTEKGLAVAQRIYERHQVLTRMLTALGVDEATAAEEACRIEHDISDGTFEKIKAHFLEKLGPETD
jgi:Mn-dependent DtxR family transcriptional regulator